MLFGICNFLSKFSTFLLLLARTTLLTLMPSHLETALKGRRARSVLIDLKAGISAAPSHTAAKFINDNYKLYFKFGSLATNKRTNSRIPFPFCLKPTCNSKKWQTIFPQWFLNPKTRNFGIQKKFHVHSILEKISPKNILLTEFLTNSLSPNVLNSAKTTFLLLF